MFVHLHTFKIDKRKYGRRTSCWKLGFHCWISVFCILILREIDSSFHCNCLYSFVSFHITNSHFSFVFNATDINKGLAHGFWNAYRCNVYEKKEHLTEFVICVKWILVKSWESNSDTFIQNTQKCILILTQSVVKTYLIQNR